MVKSRQLDAGRGRAGVGDNLALARGPGPGADHLPARCFEPFGVSGRSCDGRGGLLFPCGAGDLPGPDHGRRAVAVSLPGCRRRG